MEGRSSTAPSAHRTPPFRTARAAGARETVVLIEAWDDRFIEVYRGSLHQKQWQEVVNAVNSRPYDARRPPRTDVRCKNRVDTLKKKYKSERSKIDAGSSSWNFNPRMDFLIGPSVIPAVKEPSLSPPPLALPQGEISAREEGEEKSLLLFFPSYFSLSCSSDADDFCYGPRLLLLRSHATNLH